jgi:hypothetical protein
MPDHIPDDDQTVIIRRLFFAPPFEAVYDATAQVFISTSGDLVIPWHLVSRWREV